MRKALSFLAVLVLAVAVFGQAPPATNTAQFTVNLNFLGSTAFGSSSALDVASTTQFTANSLLRFDIFTIPGNGYTGYFLGPQDNLMYRKFKNSFLRAQSDGMARKDNKQGDKQSLVLQLEKPEVVKMGLVI